MKTRQKEKKIFIIVKIFMIFHLINRVEDNRTRSLVGEITYVKTLYFTRILFKGHYTSTALYYIYALGLGDFLFFYKHWLKSIRFKI